MGGPGPPNDGVHKCFIHVTLTSGLNPAMAMMAMMSMGGGGGGGGVDPTSNEGGEGGGGMAVNPMMAMMSAMMGAGGGAGKTWRMHTISHPGRKKTCLTLQSMMNVNLSP